VRGEKPVNEPDGPLGLAFSEKESGQLMRSHPYLSERRGGEICTFLSIFYLYVFITTQFRHGRELATVR
jgi:hypothetical protein